MALNLGTLLATLKLDSAGFTRGAAAAGGVAKQLGAALGGVGPRAQQVGDALVKAAAAARRAAADFKVADDATRASLKAAGARLEAFDDMGGGTAAAGLAGIAGGLALVGGAAIKAASAFEETTNLITTGFGSASVSVEEWAKSTAVAMGRSQQQMRDFAGSLQVMLIPLVENQQAAASMSTELSKLAVDLGSFFNVADKDALVALKAGLTGEVEPLKRFGVVLTEAQMNAYALAQGMGKTVQKMTEAEKVQLRYNMILARTTLVQGDAVKTAGSFANQAKRAEANVENLAVAFGEPLRRALTQVLVPFNALADGLRDVAPWVFETAARVGVLVTVLSGGAAAVLGMSLALGGIAALLPVIAAGFSTFATVVLPVIVIITSLVVIFGLLRKAWISVRDDVIAGASQIGSRIAEMGRSAIDGFAKLSTGVLRVILDVGLLSTRLVAALADKILGVVEAAISKLRGVAEKLGLGDVFAGMAAGVRSARQDIAYSLEGLNSLADNIVQAFDVREIAKNTADFLGGPGGLIGTMLEVGKEAGGQLVDGIKMGLGSAGEFLADVLGVDRGSTTKPLVPGVDMPPMPKTPPAPEKVKAFEDAAEAAEPAIATSLRQAIDQALADEELWKGTAYDFAFGIADNLHEALTSGEIARIFGDDVAKSLRDAIESGAHGLADFLESEGGKRTVQAGASLGDALMGGSLDLSSFGGIIGDAIAPGIGGAIGSSIGGAISSVVDAIKEQTAQLVDGLSSMASQIGGIILSGAQRTGAVVGAAGGAVDFGKNFLSAAWAAGSLVAIFGALGAVVGALGVSLATSAAMLAIMFAPLALILAGLALALAPVIALVALIVGPVVSALVSMTGAMLAFVAALGLGVLWFVALLQIGTMTKSFERFSLALEWGARAIVDATEPLFAALMPVAGVLVIVMQAFAQLTAVFLTLLESAGVFRFLFDMTVALASAFANGALAILDGAEAVVKFAKWFAGMIGAESLVESLQAFDDGIDGMQSTLQGTIATLTDLTYEEAMARAVAAASAEELAAAMDAATAGSRNLPEAFKLASARGRAIIGGLGDADGIGPADRRLPIVNVWINGQRAEDIRREFTAGDRFRALVESRIPLMTPRRRNGVTRAGN